MDKLFDGLNILSIQPYWQSRGFSNFLFLQPIANLEIS